MSPENRAILESYGVDVKRTLARFTGNEALMLSFMKELDKDECMPAIRAARERGDEAAFRSNLHALKGLAGNLGLTPLYELCTSLMDALRADDEPGRERLYPLVLAEFDRAVDMVSRLREE